MKKTTKEKIISYANTLGVTEVMKMAVNPDISELVLFLSNESNYPQLFSKDRKGRTALDWARMCRNYKAISLLMHAITTAINNARVNSVTSFNDFENFVITTNETQGIQLREAIQSRNVELALQILQENRLIRKEVEGLNQIFFTDLIYPVGYTALILAAGMNMRDVVRELIRLEAPINHSNKFGHSALTIACASGNSDIAEYLLFHKADVFHATSEGRTSLHYACLYAKAKIVKIIFHYLIDEFTIERIENHPLVKFDYTRWTIYTERMLSLLNARDKDKKLAEELLPLTIDDKYRIERRLRISGITGLEPLNPKLKFKDTRSLDTNYSFADNSRQSKEIEENEEMNSQQIEERSQFTQSISEKENDDDDADSNNIQFLDDIDYISEISLNSESNSLPEWSHFSDDLIDHDANIQDIYSVKTSMPLEEEVEYIIKLIDKIRLKIARWESNAKQEEELAKLLPCPLDCGAELTLEDMNNHVRDGCIHRATQCKLCLNSFRNSEVHEHEKKKCLKRLILCKNHKSGCNEMVVFDNMDYHLRFQCVYRLSFCRQFCNLQIPYYQRDIHEKDHCENRIISCDRCKEQMQAKLYPSHLLNTCVERIVLCSVGCGESFSYRNLHHHEQDVCLQYCRYKCVPNKMGPPVKLKYHEDYVCPKKPMDCCYECGIKGLTRGHVSFHQEFQCPQRFVQCDSGCGDIFHAYELQRHAHPILGNCSERLVHCPNDLIGWKIFIIDRQLEGYIVKFRRVEIKSSSRRKNSNSFKDEIYVKSSKGFSWFPLWKTNFTLLEKPFLSTISNDSKANSSNDPNNIKGFDEQFSCGWLRYASISEHLNVYCPQRSLVFHPEKGTYANENNSSSQFLGQETKLKDMLSTVNSHIAYQDTLELDSDDTPCPFCGQDIPRSQLQAHEDITCTEYLLFCPLACGKQIKRRDIEHHTSEICSKRIVVCPQCNSDDLWFEELNEHIVSKCPDRIIPCPLGCDISDLHACQCQDHTQNICELRPILCKCGVTLQAKDLAEHKLYHCDAREVLCPHGCGATIPYFSLENHAEFYCPKSKEYIYGMILECPNGCGEALMRKDVIEHISYNCTKRLVECPQHCGNTVPLDVLDSHIGVCPQRLLCCEPNMNMCAKAFHLWLCRFEELENSNTSIFDESTNISQSYVEKIENNIEFPNSDRVEVDNEEKSIGVSSDTSTAFSISNIKQIPIAKSDRNIEQLKSETLFRGSNVKITVNSSLASDNKNLFDKLSIKHKNISHFSNSFQGSSLNQGNNLEEHTIQTTTAASSVYLDGHAMKFRERLRMVPCEYHKMNIMMAAIRYDDLPLMESVARQIEESSDIDMENVYGDTTLTLACRMGKLSFVQILVQCGADINMETTNGRTALIEAVKCAEENIPLIEYLIKEGSIVNYRTARHQRTALDWARRYATSDAALLTEQFKQKKITKHINKKYNLQIKYDPDSSSPSSKKKSQGLLEDKQADIIQSEKTSNSKIDDIIISSSSEEEEITDEKKRNLGRPRTVRILELAAVVQYQCNMLFQKIATGQSDWVLKVIGEGDFFAPDNEEKAYENMKKHVQLAEEADESLHKVQQKLYGFNKGINNKHLKQKNMEKVLASMEESIQYLQAKETALDRKINQGFILFEQMGALLNSVEIEEIARYHYPDKLLILSWFIYAQLYHKLPDNLNIEELDLEEPISNVQLSNLVNKIFASKDLWWPQLKKEMLTSGKELLVKLKGFNRARIHYDRTKQLLQRCRRFLQCFDILTRDERIARGLFTLIQDAPDSPNGSRPGTIESKKERKKSKKKKNRRKIESELIPDDKSEFSNESPSRLSSPSMRNRALYSSGGENSSRMSTPSKQFKNFSYEETSDLFQKDSEFEDLNLSNNHLQVKEDDDSDVDEDEVDPLSRGTWVKGEWVPYKYGQSPIKEKGKQFSLASTTVILTDALIQEEKEKTIQTISNLKHCSFQAVSNDDFSYESNKQETNDLSITSSRPQTRDSISSSKPSSRRSKRGSKRPKRDSVTSTRSSTFIDPKDIAAGVKTYKIPKFDEELVTMKPLLVFHMDEYVGYPFVEIMIHLLQTIHTYTLYYPYILELREQKIKFIRNVEEMKGVHIDISSSYQVEYDKRAAIEQEYIRLLKKSKFLHDKVRVFREKVRVARLMNYVSVNGHTAISYAASYGCYDMVEEMLSRGGSVGFTAPILHHVATFLQLSYRIYRTSLKLRASDTKKKVKSDQSVHSSITLDLPPPEPALPITVPKEDKDSLPAFIDPTAVVMKKAQSMQIIKDLTMLKDKRAKLLKTIHYLRSHIRFPVPEAIFAGKWEIVQRIYERKLLHYNFINTWIYPSPPPPYSRNLNYLYIHDKITLEEVATHGMNELAAGIYLPETGWVGPNHPSDPFGEMFVFVQDLMQKLKLKIHNFLQGRYRIRILRNEKQNQVEGEKLMIDYIYDHAFEKCIDLAINRGITIDLETPDGTTCLIMASEENSNSVNHQYLVNSDGSKCLAVEYLLDRKFYRPAINLETKIGYTALIRASMLGRNDVVVALLERGANINYQNTEGRTALHYAILHAHGETTRLLVERFANINLPDKYGLTSYQYAEQENFIDLMKILSQFQTGNLGELQLSRGNINDHILCPIGCGEKIFPYQRENHLLVCVNRDVDCPNLCGSKIMFKDIENHMTFDCAERFIPCSLCQEPVKFSLESEHQAKDCTHRMIPCPLGCPRILPAYELDRHVVNCNYKIIECTFHCGAHVRAIDLPQHQQDVCPNRRVPCTNKCGNLIVFHTMDYHRSQYCQLRLVECTQCHEMIKKKDEEHHMQANCSYRLVPCPEKCGEQLPWALINDHLSTSCLKKCEFCPLQCGMSLQRAFIPSHIEKECPERWMLCQNLCQEIDYQDKDGVHGKELTTLADFQYDIPQSIIDSGLILPKCTIKGPKLSNNKQNIDLLTQALKEYKQPCVFMAKLLPFHLKYECPTRPVTCSQCTEVIPFCKLIPHQSESCNRRLVPCRNPGCLKQIPLFQQEYHEFNECRFRLIECPQACGEMVIALHCVNHKQRVCKMRFISCTLGCGLQMRAQDLDVHLQEECVRRHQDEDLETNDLGKTSSPSRSRSRGKSRKVPEKSKEEIEAEALKEKMKFSSDILGSLKLLKQPSLQSDDNEDFEFSSIPRRSNKKALTSTVSSLKPKSTFKSKYFPPDEEEDDSS